ncbi:MAG: rRNA pseudouridine synthase [Clostridia bacterium]|nr:rRNA pseudouridine synthase [Clostridia bacterium]MDD7671312.1 pseudouridine synthase [Clostridia bacterium]MDY2929624.1 pseudouridine synthase [Clostridiaceae bacterium]
MTGRLDRLLASCALISRTEAQSALRAGRVTVDGIVCRDGAGKYDTEKNVILLNGQRVEGDGFVYLMLNKPVGVLSATEDKKGETTALDLLPEPYQKAGPGVVGRLDKDAHGLLFLTSNGQLNHRLTSPRRHADKVYRVALDAPAGAEDEEAFARGMDLGDFTTLPAGLERLEDGRICLVTLREGKFHQIKRMFAHRGKTVVDLQRLSIGPLTLDPALAPGDFRPLTGEEIRTLLTAADMM